MSDDVHVHSGHDCPHVALPFNSKHLTAEQIKCVAQALEVPTEAAATEVCLMIEGMLRELGCEPAAANVQVLVSASSMSLLDEGEELWPFQSTMTVSNTLRIDLINRRVKTVFKMDLAVKLNS